MIFAILLQITLSVFIFKINKINALGQFYTTVENKQYYVDQEKEYTLDNSIIECFKLNMSLITIGTIKEEEAINKLLLNKTNFPDVPQLWIGGLIIPGTRTAIWIHTGRLFESWYRGNPDYTFNCIFIGYKSKTQWTDGTCTNKRGFICEYPSELKLQEDHEKLKEEFQIQMEKIVHLQDELNKEKQLSVTLKQQLEAKTTQEADNPALESPSSQQEPAQSLPTAEANSLEVPNNETQEYRSQFLFSHVYNAFFMPNIN
ncbi:lectin subunit alpha-like isoform X1 [Lucilia cuprina]|uniref:lectin subunit alpha-like isoform X1 n=1 Tax=Lucilia cuprina TaxID=7375 RepID=UPI001F058674|nr:lectin subunit alpha-like isoform X1 [Lucilia cuprina]XP_046812487.1 lectin subunit alpha-like isoform X1 [Lucilia cuprina]